MTMPSSLRAGFLPVRGGCARPRCLWVYGPVWSAGTIHGLAQYHRVSGFEPAVDLAGRLTRYLVHHGRYYGPDGEFLPNYGGQGEMDEGWARDGQGFNPGPPPVNNLIHFQHHMVPLLGTLDHALAVGDANLADFVRHSFEWARTKGNALLGYFPENIDNYAELETSELCEVAGMIGLALKLSAAGWAITGTTPTAGSAICSPKGSYFDRNGFTTVPKGEW